MEPSGRENNNTGVVDVLLLSMLRNMGTIVNFKKLKEICYEIIHENTPKEF